MKKNETLASDILHDLKISNKKWFIAFLVVLLLWFATIGMFVWYVNLPQQPLTIEQNNSPN